jgi:transposase
MMETKPRGRREGSTNYSLAFKQQVAAEASEPAKSVAEVACEHGVNANMVAHWRRRFQTPTASQRIQPTETFLAMQIAPESSRDSAIVVEHGEFRVRFEGALYPATLQLVPRTLRSAV